MRFTLRLGSFATRCARSALSLALARWQRCVRSPPLRLTPRVGRPGAALRARPAHQAKAVRLTTKLSLRVALLLWAPLAVAQSNLGELLDAGAKKLSIEEFKEQVVQRVIVGPTASGGNLEVMYAHSGVIAGRGAWVPGANTVLAPISGEWTTDDNGRVCTSMRIGSNPGLLLPPRCQFWFKYTEEYFFSDSDSDRHVRVLRRTVKQ